MSCIDLIVPTVEGREDVFAKTVEAFSATTGDHEVSLIVPENHPTVGDAWNAGFGDVDADYVFFAIDDCEPQEGWLDTALETVAQGYIPAPRLMRPDGMLESCGSMGWGALLPEAADWTPCRSGGVLFMPVEWHEAIGNFLPIHYSADDDYCWRAHLAGHDLVYREAFCFTHHHEIRGNEHNVIEAQNQIKQTLLHMAQLKLRDEQKIG